jgi:hypothetical protein
VIGQVLLVFVMVGLLALLLRWAFSRGKNAPEWPGPESSGTHPATNPTPEIRPAAESTDPPSGPEPQRRSYVPGAHDPGSPTAPALAASGADDDFGLLAVAATVPTAEEAARVRRVLAGAGIRATTTVGHDGRHRVLVFASDVLRARRVAG